MRIFKFGPNTEKFPLFQDISRQTESAIKTLYQNFERLFSELRAVYHNHCFNKKHEDTAI